MIGPANPPEAVKWFRLAAEHGSPAGQNSLGYSYDIGAGVIADPVEAYKWYSLAVAAGERNAKVNMAKLLPRLTLEQIAAGKAEAAAFSPSVPSSIPSPFD